MMWRPRDPAASGLRRRRRTRQYATVVEDLYARTRRRRRRHAADARPGRPAGRDVGPRLRVVAARVPPEHLAARQRLPGAAGSEASPDDPGLFGDVDWSRTRAYGLGLERPLPQRPGARGERHRRARSTRRARARDRGEAARDDRSRRPAQPAVTKVFRREDVYAAAGLEDVAPDLVVGYAKGTRTSDESALGGHPAGGDRGQQRRRGAAITAWIPTRCRASC